MNNIVMEMHAGHRRIERMLANLSDEQLMLIENFTEQVIRCQDPDAVKAFVTWRQDPRIESILSLFVELGDDKRDQLLFAAEDLYDSSQNENSPLHA